MLKARVGEQGQTRVVEKVNREKRRRIQRVEKKTK